MEKKSTNPLKSILTIIISLAFAGFFLWLALRDFDFDIVKKSLAKANYMWVVFAAVFGVLAYWFRAVRWNLLLEPMGHHISNSNAFWTISFGYLMNLTIPRSGEVARATALYGVEKVPADKSFGTIILERVVDLVCMMGFLGLTLIFKYDVILSFYQNSGININPNKVILIISILALSAILFFAFKKKLSKVPVLDKIIGFIDGIIQGLTSIFKLKQKVKFILYTLGIWICYYMAAYLVCFALPETSDFTIADGFFIIVVGTLGMIVPASGGIGAFNLAMKYGFMALFLSMGKSAEFGGEMGLTYSFISLPLQIVIMLTTGLLSIPMLAKARNKLAADTEIKSV
ncbi:lysylphosphatidylglycerol synthase transmembrane domain-containing protein [Chryseobacterium sp. Hurlbut01]|uniref:lysylphosphatidylglycerol synthase transmembrane domain-containing protein n=1 Tax=Chryseobacterium sp. Hurlbut01 TaxID=1681828 RepID=UPI00067B1DE7|nr:lysylphosphatidylglycerol synthase transmembrane domain-containing protein [Chryseobacterium sp. Hurlbut01]KNB61092.1 membrane protein [Chryseobacterium sp. Hurlbut01]